MNTQNIILDVSKEPAVLPVLYLGQGDRNGTTLVAEIYDNGVPLDVASGYGARFEMRLPDSDTYYSVDGTLSGNVATVEIDEAYAGAIAGKTNIAYIDIYNGTTVICSTNRINVVVLRSAQDGADPSTAYSNGIAEATERANDAAEAAEGVVLQAVPLMSATVRGGAQLGDGLVIEDGKLSLDGSAAVPIATTSTPGIVKPDGTTITVTQDGEISGASTYELPTMSASTKGGAKVGSGLDISNDVLSVDIEPSDIGAYTTAEVDAELASQRSSILQSQTLLNAIGTVPVGNGGTGATTAAGARANLNAASATDLDALVAKGIGTRKAVSPSASSCANGTWKEVASISLESGVWVVAYGGAFDTNATGHRDLHFDSSAPGAGRYSPLVAAVSGEQTRMNATTVLTISSTTTFRLYARQNSGGALDFYAYIQAGKIG